MIDEIKDFSSLIKHRAYFAVFSFIKKYAKKKAAIIRSFVVKNSEEWQKPAEDYEEIVNQFLLTIALLNR